MNDCAQKECEWEGCDGRHLVMTIEHPRAKSVDIDLPFVCLTLAEAKDEKIRANVSGAKFVARTVVYR